MKPSPIAALTLVSWLAPLLPLSEGVGRADQPPSVVKHQPVWEYKAEHCGYNSGLPAQLNELGTEGWELVQIADGIAVFKRMKSCTTRQYDPVCRLSCWRISE